MSNRKLCMGVIVLTAVFAYGGGAHADEQFTLRSLSGTFAFSGSGTLQLMPPVVPVPALVSAAVVGLTSFDGLGGCVTTAVLNAAGTVSPLTSATCSYAVNPDGTGSHDVAFAGLGSFTSTFVIVDAKKEVYFMLSDGLGGGTVASGVSKRQVGRED